MCGVPGPLALFHRCARQVCLMRGVRGDLVLVHRCSCCLCYGRCIDGTAAATPPPCFLLVVLCLLLFHFEESERRGQDAQKRQVQASAPCSSAVSFFVVCVACVSLAAALQGRGTCVTVYMNAS